MTWCSSCDDVDRTVDNHSASSTTAVICKKLHVNYIKNCPSCGHPIQWEEQATSSSGIQDLPGLPAGVKFDPSDQELLEHLEGKARPDTRKLHPLIDEFIPTIEGENGICYTHPERLPGVGKDGLIRHFFHRPSKAYTTGTRKRRKVHTEAHGGETRWHKTGKTRAVLVNGKLKGYKKILVLYTNYGKQRKPEKTNWVMHQYHLGCDEEEKDGELVVSKVFYQTQPRQCGAAAGKEIITVSTKSNCSDLNDHESDSSNVLLREANIVGFYNPSLISYDQGSNHRETTSPHMIPNFAVHERGTTFLP